MNFKFKSIILFTLVVLFSCADMADKKEKDTPKTYQLVWADEFETNGRLDSLKWTYEYGYIREGKRQYYTDRLQNVRAEKGFLILEARKEKIKNKTPFSIERPEVKFEKDSTDYTSASITTTGLAQWKYGRIEIKAKLAGGRGVWPAIWMLGENWQLGKGVAWPKCGEIDIMEHVGFEKDSIYAVVHTQAYNGMHNTQPKESVFIDDPYDKFHTYTIEWTPEKIGWFLDEKETFIYKNEHKTVDEWPFDQPFHLKLNVAVGGGWGGQKGIDDSMFPQRMIIDYVRVYQKK